jgi:O-antigen ligase
MSRVLFHLAAVMFVIGLLSVGLWYAMPGNSLGRALGAAQPRGFVHPNLAAQAAGGALLVVLACSLIWQLPWAQKLTPLAFLIAAFLLYVAHSRTAIAVALLGIAGCLLISGRRKLLLTVSLASILLVALYLALDPHGSLLETVSGEAITYTLRGQSREQFASASGRAAMWGLGIRSFLRSPLIGHGHWMITPTGMALVWGEYQWETLHNLVLHVLAGTGIVGGLLFAWALARPLNVARLGLKRGAGDRAVAGFALLVFVWFLVLGIYELSFLGPVSPVSVFFFGTLGIVAGRL